MAWQPENKSSLKNKYYSDCFINRGGGVSPPQRRKEISLFCAAETARPCQCLHRQLEILTWLNGEVDIAPEFVYEHSEMA